mmetsp:Transcript_18974/g.29229  ORF Transcript_18974/g.29229 Transcript_18974/m.29229 type:complete len:408 (+) Transcript_18974:215-1438(+)
MKIIHGALLCVIFGSASIATTTAFTSPVTKGLSGKTFGIVTKSSSFGGSALAVQSRTGTTSTARNMVEDDEEFDDEEGPLSDGVDSVSWLPTVVGGEDIEIESIRDGAEILPLFPLGGLVYTPNSEHVLNIFEPRYRQMYTDILMNGSKRFVVTMSHPTEQGRFAQTGVLFELEDLKEVSEQTADQIKYICNHKVTGRVKLHKILNPEAWSNRDTYLKVEGTITDDTGKETEEAKEGFDETDIYGAVAAAKEASLSPAEKSLRDSFQALVNIQHDLEEDVRFTKASVDSLAISDGPGEDGLWQTIRLWQSYVEQRLVGRQNELQRDFQEKLQDFLMKEKGLNNDELPSAIGFQDLSPALQEEVKELQKRMAVELEPLILESTLTMQKNPRSRRPHGSLQISSLFHQQ